MYWTLKNLSKKDPGRKDEDSFRSNHKCTTIQPHPIEPSTSGSNLLRPPFSTTPTTRSLSPPRHNVLHDSSTADTTIIVTNHHHDSTDSDASVRCSGRQGEGSRSAPHSQYCSFVGQGWSSHVFGIAQGRARFFCRIPARRGVLVESNGDTSVLSKLASFGLSFDGSESGGVRCAERCLRLPVCWCNELDLSSIIVCCWFWS